MNAVQALFEAPQALPSIALRDYQAECLQTILAEEQGGVRRQLVVLPTGAGKTILFAALIDRLLAERGGRALILAHRDELIGQAADKFRRVAGDRWSIGVVKAERNECDRQVLVGSIQTLARAQRLRQLPLDELTIVVADECHHSAARTWREVLRACGCWDPTGPLLVGVTATPDRADERTIAEVVFEKLVYSQSIVDLIDAGYLCDVEARTVHIAADLSTVHSRGGDLDAGELSRALLHANAPARVLEAYSQFGMGRKAICFTPGVKLAYDMAALFSAAGIPAAAADGTTAPEVRRQVLSQFARGEISVLCNDSLWTEGFDEPSVDCIILARPTKSRALYTQMLGRGLRLFPGKTNCLVLDLAGNAGRHDVASVPEIFGLSACEDTSSIQDAVKRQKVVDAATARDRVRDLEAARLVSETISLFRRRGLHWVAVHTDKAAYMALDLGDHRLLKVGEAPGGWCQILNEAGRRPTLLASGLTQQQAWRSAEEYARLYGKAWAVRPRPAWRAQPASPATRVYARALGIHLPAGCTRGEAADAILTHHAIHGIQPPKSPPR